jgi:hypothetical protein
MSDLGRMLMVLGVVLFVVGALLTFSGRIPRLPGDILIRRDTYTIYMPITTSIFLSVILTVVLSLLVRR